MIIFFNFPEKHCVLTLKQTICTMRKIAHCLNIFASVYMEKLLTLLTCIVQSQAALIIGEVIMLVS